MAFYPYYPGTKYTVLDATADYQTVLAQGEYSHGQDFQLANVLGVADFNGDSVLDMYWAGEGPAKPLRVLSGADGFQTVLYASTWGSASHLVGDFDGDGRGDLYSIANGTLTVRSAASGLTTTLLQKSLPSLTAWRTGDLDADGRSDLFGQSSSGEVVVLSGSSQYATVMTTFSWSRFDTAGDLLADYNGDGISDWIAVAQPWQAEETLRVYDGAVSFTDQIAAIPDVAWPDSSILVAPAIPVQLPPEVDPEAQLEEDDVPDVGPPFEDITLYRTTGSSITTRNRSDNLVPYPQLPGESEPDSRLRSKLSSWWDGVCTDGEHRYSIIKYYKRPNIHPRMEGDRTKMYCGKADRYDQLPHSEAAFGIRHIRDGNNGAHRSQFRKLAAWEGHDWGNFMHWAISWTLYDPDHVTNQQPILDNRFCYEKEFGFEYGDNVENRKVVVLTGRTAVRIITSFPRKTAYCSGESVN